MVSMRLPFCRFLSCANAFSSSANSFSNSSRSFGDVDSAIACFHPGIAWFSRLLTKQVRFCWKIHGFVAFTSSTRPRIIWLICGDDTWLDKSVAASLKISLQSVGEKCRNQKKKLNQICSIFLENCAIKLSTTTAAPLHGFSEKELNQLHYIAKHQLTVTTLLW